MKLIVNVAGGRWPRPDRPIYEAFPSSIPFTKAFQWTSLVDETPVTVPVKYVIEKIDATAGSMFPLTDPNATDPLPGDKFGMFHWDYEPTGGVGHEYHLFRQSYNATLCNQWLQICLAAVRHLKEDPAKQWEVSLWGMPLLPVTSGVMPVMADLQTGGSAENYGRTINHLTPLWMTMDFCLVSFYLRDTHVRSGPMAIYNWTRGGMELMQALFGYKCIPAIMAHYSRGSGRHRQFVDYIDLILQLYAFKAAKAERLWLWFGITSQAAAEGEAKWIKSVFVPAWQTVFDDLIVLDPTDSKNPQETDLVGVIDQEQEGTHGTATYGLSSANTHDLKLRFRRSGVDAIESDVEFETVLGKNFGQGDEEFRKWARDQRSLILNRPLNPPPNPIPVDPPRPTKPRPVG